MVLERLDAVERMQRELGQVYDRACVGHFGVGRQTMQSSRQAGPARHPFNTDPRVWGPARPEDFTSPPLIC